MSPTTPAMPLAGIRVIELGTLIAGPYAASLLAQFGAEVVKIETLGPKIGEHTDAVLTAIGFDAAQLAALKADRVI